MRLVAFLPTGDTGLQPELQTEKVRDVKAQIPEVISQLEGNIIALRKHQKMQLRTCSLLFIMSFLVNTADFDLNGLSGME